MGITERHEIHSYIITHPSDPPDPRKAALDARLTAGWYVQDILPHTADKVTTVTVFIASMGASAYEHIHRSVK